MSINLYDYQKEVIGKLHTGSILQAGVGTGKSITALVYFFNVVCGGDFENSKAPTNPIDLYIITTARKRDSLEWHQECSKIGVYPGEDYYGINVVVDSWNNIKKYVDVKNAFFIFDEQRVVGYGAWSKSFLKVTKNNQWIILTATPGDVWMDYLSVFIANGFYKNKTEFVRRHVIYNPHTTYPQVLRYIHCGELLKHKSDITVVMRKKIRKERHHKFVDCGYSKKDLQTVKKSLWDIYKNEPIENASQLCYAMRRVVNSSPCRLSKLTPIIDRHKKCIIFYNYNYELDDLRVYCEQHNIPYAEWNGSKHEAIPVGSKWVYLVQYTAGAEGWNAIQTNTIIFYSLSYSYKVMIQSAGRIDRVNSPYKDLYYYYMTSQSIIDKKIQKALHNKKDFNKATIVPKGFFDETRRDNLTASPRVSGVRSRS